MSLDAQYHPAAVVVHLPSIKETLQSHDTEEMRVSMPSSPTPSSTSSLSLYSAESAKKSGEGGERGGKKKVGGGGGGGGFCLCFSAFLYLSLTFTQQGSLLISRLLIALRYQI